MKALLFILAATLGLIGCGGGDSKPPHKISAGEGVIGDNKARISSIIIGTWMSDCKKVDDTSTQQAAGSGHFLISFDCDVTGTWTEGTETFSSSDCTGAVKNSEYKNAYYTLRLDDNLEGKFAYDMLAGDKENEKFSGTADIKIVDGKLDFHITHEIAVINGEDGPETPSQNLSEIIFTKVKPAASLAQTKK